MSGQGTQRWTGRRVLIALLLFFGVVAAVNGVMVWIALDSWPGRSPRESRYPASAPVVITFVKGDETWTG